MNCHICNKKLKEYKDFEYCINRYFKLSCENCNKNDDKYYKSMLTYKNEYNEFLGYCLFSKYHNLFLSSFIDLNISNLLSCYSELHIAYDFYMPIDFNDVNNSLNKNISRLLNLKVFL